MSVLNRATLYELIIGQLKADGYDTVSAELAQTARTPFQSIAASSRLETLVRMGMVMEQHQANPHNTHAISSAAASSDEVSLAGHTSSDAKVEPGQGLDMEASAVPIEPSVLDLKITFTALHKFSSRVATFSKDGRFAASGSADTTIKLIDASKSSIHSRLEGEDESLKVLRTFYDHVADITHLEFHPVLPTLMSSSKDGTIKFFDVAKASTKRAYRFLQESSSVRSFSVHPGGDYMVVGTHDNVIRLYQVHTFQCYTSSNTMDHHKGSIHEVAYADTGNMYASGAQDGALKLWDTISGRCIKTFERAHDGDEVTSVRISRNGKYVLSSGLSGSVKLWDIAAAREIVDFAGCVNKTIRSKARFNFNEQLVYANDESNNCVVAWDVRTGEKLRNYAGNPYGNPCPVRYIATCPVINGFLACCDDSRSKFWTN